MRPGGEEERRRRAAHPSSAECDTPDAGGADGKRAVGLPAVTAARVGEQATAAEIGDDEIAAVTSEAARCQRDAPWLVERGRNTGDQSALEVELVHIPTGRRVVSVHRRLSGVRDEDTVAERGDTERRIAGPDRRVGEATRDAHAPPPRVEHDHSP